LNVESDHLDCYHDIEEIVGAFADFAARVDPAGVLLCCGDDERAQQAASAARCRVETFGFGESADWRATGLRSDSGRFAFEIELRGAQFLSAQLAIPGRHNVSNALAAVALAHHAGAEPERVGEALATFRGVDRRMTWRGEGRGVTIVDDYAHHPTEIRVTIAAARQRYAPRRTWVVFQPHQASRTQYFMDQFAASFGEADEVVMPDVYLARDKSEPADRPGSLELATRICRVGGKARYVPKLSEVAALLAGEVAEGDLVLTMGAGDVWKVADELVERLCGSNRARSASRAADVVSPGGPCSVSVPAA
jgi:UDP-N-acetylmuramate--alanine ligase